MGSNNFKYLHTMMRVNDLDESINFYSKMFGMQLLRKSDYPDGKFTLAFLVNSFSIIDIISIKCSLRWLPKLNISHL